MKYKKKITQVKNVFIIIFQKFGFNNMYNFKLYAIEVMKKKW